MDPVWKIEKGKTIAWHIEPVSAEESREFNRAGRDRNVIHYEGGPTLHLKRFIKQESGIAIGKDEVMLSGAHLVSVVCGMLVERFGDGVTISEIKNLAFLVPLFSGKRADCAVTFEGFGGMNVARLSIDIRYSENREVVIATAEATAKKLHVLTSSSSRARSVA
jgi:hypothetical protein